MFSEPSRVWPALLLSILMHALVAYWYPNMESALPVMHIASGELVPPAEPLPEKKEEPPPLPPPPEPEPPKPSKPLQADEPRQVQNKPNTGVALPVLSADPESSASSDYVVQEVPPLKPSDALPFASKPGTETLDKAQLGSVDGDAQVDPPTSLVDDDALQAFGRDISAYVAEHKTYPSVAMRRGWQGKAKVQVSFSGKNTIDEIVIKDSSGHKVLDDQAVEMVRKACAAMGLPEKLRGRAFVLVVPIDFKLGE